MTHQPINDSASAPSALDGICGRTVACAPADFVIGKTCAGRGERSLTD